MMSIRVDNRFFNVRVMKRVSMPPSAPRLVVVSYMPNQAAQDILEACLASIRAFTPEEHELWVVDNCSPRRHRRWLIAQEQVNVILNDILSVRRRAERRLVSLWRRPRQEQDGSYANGVALEIAAKVIDPASQYMMTLHMDTLACRPGWLSHLLDKLNKSVRKAEGLGDFTGKFPVADWLTLTTRILETSHPGMRCK